ncbi:MAG: M48 family metallopeptidase [Myxococcales bacterium]|nr:M48 family metallopeptidase [Myxococcales bacterium]
MSERRENPEPPPPPPGGFRMGRRHIVVELLVAGVALVALVMFFVSSSAWMAGMALKGLPVSMDKSLGRAAAAQIELAQPRCTNPSAQHYVEEIVARLAEEMHDSRFEYYLVLLDAPSVNAFALPGGFVFVHSGLLEAAQSGAEVAGVLAHELSHVALRHGVQAVLRSVGRLTLIGIVFGVSDAGVLLGHGASLHDLSYGRDHEAEADSMGHALLKRAGISPLGLATFFDRLRRDEIEAPEFFSSHPDSAKRARAAQDAAMGFVETTIVPAPVPCHRLEETTPAP